MRRWGSLYSGAAWVLAALLAVGIPGPAAAAATAVASAEGSLSVETNPAGAVVYVDGKAQGSAPLNVAKLSPGDHRVRVVKDGYLENSRVVSVPAGGSRAVQVRLTANPGLSLASPQVEEKSEKKEKEQEAEGEEDGGGHKGLWITLGIIGGAGLIGTGLYFLLRDTNKAPNAGTITVSPTTGMVGTSYTFTSNASDPDGDTVTATWNYGDGSTGTGLTSSHTYTSAGSYQVTLEASDGKKKSSAPAVTVVVARNLAGTWSGGTIPYIYNAPSLELTQSGNTLGGTFVLAAYGNSTGGRSTLTGNISTSPLTYPCNITWSTYFYGLSINFSGTVDASGNSMSGTVSWTASGYGTYSGTTTFRR